MYVIIQKFGVSIINFELKIILLFSNNALIEPKWQ